MGWGRGEAEWKGRMRPVGYAVEAKCDKRGCKTRIDRGLAYCCGSMHGGDHDDGCGGYYCLEHITPSKHNCERYTFL